MFIDASNEFEKGKNRNILREHDVQKIISTYNQRKSIEKYSKTTLLEEIDINNIRLKINGLNEEILNIDREIEQCLKEIM